MFVQNRIGLIESTETLMAQSRRMDQIANNLANVDTTGYKKENVTFWEMLFTASNGRPRVGKAPKIITDHAQGTTELTGNPLDLALTGPGYFRIQSPQGIRYTRAGNFHLDAQGQLVTTNGMPVLGQGGPITIEGEQVVIAQDGTVAVDGAVVDRLAVVDFADPASVEKEGANLFRLADPAAEELAAPEARVEQGYLEQSNVISVQEMTEMIDLNRAFETQQKIVRTIDDLDGEAISRVGRLSA